MIEHIKAMDRLVKPDLQELCVPFIRGKKCSATFRLTNVMHTMPVAVSLTAAEPSLFSFSQAFSIIPPLSTSSYTLLLSHTDSDQPPLCSPLDTVLVRFSMLPTGKAHQDYLRILFYNPGPYMFKDATIPISFVGPHVVESLLISEPPKSLEVAFLLSKGIFWWDKRQLNSLLMCATKSGKAYFVSAVIEAGADVNTRDPETQHSAMTLAVESGNVEFLLNHSISAKYAVTRDGRTAFDIALDEGHAHLYDMLRLGDALHTAATAGDVEAIKKCLAKGAKVNSRDQNGWTPLHRAAFKGRIESVEAPLSSGAEVDPFDDIRYTDTLHKESRYLRTHDKNTKKKKKSP